MIFVTITYEKDAGDTPEPKKVHIKYKDVYDKVATRTVTPREGHLIVNKGVYLLQKGYNANILEIRGEVDDDRVVISLPMNECQVVEIYKD